MQPGYRGRSVGVACIFPSCSGAIRNTGYGAAKIRPLPVGGAEIARTGDMLQRVVRSLLQTIRADIDHGLVEATVTLPHAKV